MAELCALTFRRVPEWSGPLTVSYLTRTNCRSWVKRQFAAPTIRGILGVESPSPDMTVPVTGCVKTQNRASEIASQLEAICINTSASLIARGSVCCPHAARGSMDRMAPQGSCPHGVLTQPGYGAAGYRTPTDRDQWVDFGMLRRTTQRQLSPKLTFALTETTAGARHGLPVAGCLMGDSCMRIADMQPSGPMVRVRPLAALPYSTYFFITPMVQPC